MDSFIERTIVKGMGPAACRGISVPSVARWIHWGPAPAGAPPLLQ